MSCEGKGQVSKPRNRDRLSKGSRNDALRSIDRGRQQRMKASGEQIRPPAVELVPW